MVQLHKLSLVRIAGYWVKFSFNIQRTIPKTGAPCQLVQYQVSILQPMDTHSTINTHRNTTCHNDRQLHIPWQHPCRCQPQHSHRHTYQVEFIISIITYSSASWTLTIVQKKRLDAFITKALRRIVGVRWYDYVTNASILIRTGQPPLTTTNR